jgi:hypothetical protein
MNLVERESNDSGFLLVGGELVPRSAVTNIDLRRVEDLEIVVTCYGVERVARGQSAIDLVMRLAPHALEGKRLRFLRHAWMVHNLIGHPILQVCAWLGLTRWGLWIHDHTIPTPLSLHTDGPT